MACRVAAAFLVFIILGCAAGRQLQQDAGPVPRVRLAEEPASDSGATQPSSTAGKQSLEQHNSNAGLTSTPIQPSGTSKRTLDQVNADAPTITDPGTGVSVRPVAASQLGGAQATPSQMAAAAAAGPAQQSVQSTQSTAADTAANTETATAQQQQHVGVVEPQNVAGATSLDNEAITGDYFSVLQGVRLATPLFGTGYNFCVDRYISSFPRVGIVIPNPAIWLLPAFQDFAAGLSTTLSLPNLLPHGAYATPTSDGFLIYLPSEQPSEVSNFGVRYGVQIGQAFGYDFGIGVLKDICSVSFVLV